MRTQKAIFLTLIFMAMLLPSVLAIDDYGEDEDYLGQVIDDYENADNIAAMIDTINNETLDCIELNYTAGIDFNDYTEVDADGDITIASTRIDWDTMKRSAVSYVYRDYGVDYFGDFAFNYTFCFTDIEAGDASNQHILASLVLTDEIGDYRTTFYPDWCGVMTRQNGLTDDQFQFRLIQYTGSALQFVEDGAYRNIGIFYLTFDRIGQTIRLRVYSDSARTTLLETLSNVGGNIDRYRYLYGIQNNGPHDPPADPNDHSTGYMISEYFDVMGYAAIGTYYTVNVLGGDPAIAILYNLTIPAGGGATMEFSIDNVTWVDHNNQAGSDTLFAGYEALDLRDIYNGTTYRRVNMTSDGADTPRMWQERFVTVTGDDFCPPCEGAPAPSMGKYYALAIILLILGILIGIGMGRRR